MKSLISLLFASIVSFSALAQDHEHGTNVPDWYDPSCCNNRDCKPVEDKDIEIFENEQGVPFLRYKPTGNIFNKNNWKPSQDERYHVCIWNGTALCAYVPWQG